MNHRLLSASLCVLALHAIAQPARAEVRATDAALALRMVDIARATLANRGPDEASLRQAAALLSGATRLDPSQARYPRLLADARAQLGDVEGTLVALAAYRRLSPHDQHAQVQVIDLHLSRMQTLDGRVTYLEQLLEQPTLAGEVRSHAGSRLVPLLHERGETTRAEAILRQALRLNPLNMEALGLDYHYADGTDVNRRTLALLGMLRSNPSRPWPSGELARLLGQVGLDRPSLEWFDFTIRCYNHLRMAAPQGLMSDYAAQLFLADQQQRALAVVDQILSSSPDAFEAILLRAMLTKADDPAFAQRVTEGERLLMAKVTGEAPGDISAVVDAAVASEDDGRRAELSHLLGDLIAYKLYVRQQPVGDLLGALEKLSTAGGDVALQRYRGWNAAVEGRVDEATALLQPIADVDPLAAMVLARVGPEPTPESREVAQRALRENCSGLLGAMLWNRLKEVGVQRQPGAAHELVLDHVEQFPKEWLNVLENPQAFYSVRVDPTKGAFAFREPILAAVTLTNVGRHDITLGGDGLLKPELWFDARTRGIHTADFTGVALDRLGGPLVLRPGQSTTQPMRLDGGQLEETLTGLPTPSVQIQFSAITNPTSTADGAVGPGVGGARFDLARMFGRSGFAVDNPAVRERLLRDAGGADPTVQLNSLDLIAHYAVSTRHQPDEQTQAVGRQFAESLRAATESRDPSTAAWAGYLVAVTESAQKAGEVAHQMAQCPAWQSKLLAATIASGLPESERDVIVSKLVEDADVDVASSAGSIATRQPASAPAPTTQLPAP